MLATLPNLGANRKGNENFPTDSRYLPVTIHHPESRNEGSRITQWTQHRHISYLAAKQSTLKHNSLKTKKHLFHALSMDEESGSSFVEWFWFRIFQEVAVMMSVKVSVFWRPGGLEGPLSRRLTWLWAGSLSSSSREHLYT